MAPAKGRHYDKAVRPAHSIIVLPLTGAVLLTLDLAAHYKSLEKFKVAHNLHAVAAAILIPLP
jgi:hypothetical protein